MESHFPQSSESIETTATVYGEFVVGQSPSMRSVEKVMLEVAQSEVPVLLLEKNGGGKQATARRIHELSQRGKQSFRSSSCAALELGRFEDAAAPEGLVGEGTVFLSELADLSAKAQARLLQALTEGNSKSAQGPARLICGSARDLEAEVKAGNLREDLYYRISGVCLRLPPLRQRREDIPVLMEHFLRKYGRDFQRAVPVLSEETQRLFEEYSWPGNVRELENAARAIMALGDATIAMGGLRAVLRRTAGDNGVRISLKQAARAASREAEK